MSFGIYIAELHHTDYRPGDRRPLAARASEVDWRRRYLSYRRSDHPRRNGDSTERSAVLDNVSTTDPVEYIEGWQDGGPC